MPISTEKNKTIVIANKPIKCKLVVEDKPMEPDIENLGMKISRIGKIEEHVEHQVNKANRIAECLNNTIFRNKFG